MDKEGYNKIPIFYCKNCLSLKIRDVEHIENSEYCDRCGSTDIAQTNVREWETLYKNKYGHYFLSNKY